MNIERHLQAGRLDTQVLNCSKHNFFIKKLAEMDTDEESTVSEDNNCSSTSEEHVAEKKKYMKLLQRIEEISKYKEYNLQFLKGQVCFFLIKYIM